MKKLLMILFLITSIFGMSGDSNCTVTSIDNNIVTIQVGRYNITYKMYLMPHVKLTDSIINRSLLASADVEAEYKFEGTVRLDGEVIATLFRVSTPKFIELTRLMVLKNGPIISLRSHSGWTNYIVDNVVEIKKRKVRDFDGRMITVRDSVYIVHTEKTERINMRVQGKRSTHVIVPLKTEPYAALWTIYTSPIPKNLSGTWVEQKE